MAASASQGLVIFTKYGSDPDPYKSATATYLYRADLALPKRQATPAQLAALGKAMTARRTCPACGTEKPYCIPRSTGECLDCLSEAVTP